MIIRIRTYILLIFLIGLLLYAKGLFNNFIGDDDLQIVRNLKVHSLSNISSFFLGSTYENAGSDQITGIFYRPIMMTVFALIYSLFGPNPLFFHLVQLLFHITNAILVFLLLREFFRDKTSFFLSLLFLVHPLNSETVLYSANLQEVLFFFFGMIALLLMKQKDYRYKKMLLVPFMILLSLFSKESGILFIIIILAYSILFDKNKKRFPFLVISITAVTTIYLFFRYVLAHMQSANNSLAPISNAQLPERLINIPLIIFYYLKSFFYPQEMGVDQFWIITSISSSTFWTPLLWDILFFFILVLPYLLIIQKYKSLKKRYLFFLIWFLAGLTLHLQILPLDVTVADRWFYFPFVGLIALFAIDLNQLKSPPLKHTRLLCNFLIILYLLVLSARTYTRISDWKTPVILYEHSISTENNFIVENAYGTALITDGQFEKAKKYILHSVSQHPYTANLNNLAIIYASEGNKFKAKETFELAIKKGVNFSVYENYANFLLYYTEPQDALIFSRKAVLVFPKSPHLWLTLAQSAYLTDNKKEALLAAEIAYKLKPDKATQEIFTMIRKNNPFILKHY